MKTSRKLAIVGAGLIMATSLTTGITTAYLMNPMRATESAVSSKSDAPRRDRGYSSGGAVAGGVTRPTPVAYPASTPRATRVAYPSSGASECATTSDRIWRIAKPGVLGGLLGAGVGAGGGAIADGGKGAGKGALIGGLLGAAAGAVYGGYKTHQECGTILGTQDTVQRPSPQYPETSQWPLVAMQAADSLGVYRAR